MKTLLRFLAPGFMLILLYNTQVSAQLKPTETQALLKIKVTDFDGKPRASENIVFVSAKAKKEYTVKTNQLGLCEILLPEGDKYDVKYKELMQQVDYSQIEIPLEIGAFTLDLIIKYEPGKVFVLEDVFFDTGKSTLRPESYKALNDLAEALKAKPSMIIEISGHTDNVGTPESNIVLSQGRAESVQKYLISKGIAASRITPVGYGDTQPVASNDTDEGRQQNRRTEVRIIKE